MKMGLDFLLLGTVAVNVCLSGGALAQTQGGGDAQPDAYTYKRVDGKEMRLRATTQRIRQAAGSDAGVSRRGMEPRFGGMDIRAGALLHVAGDGRDLGGLSALKRG
jgi:hypothetical protein